MTHVVAPRDWSVSHLALSRMTEAIHEQRLEMLEYLRMLSANAIFLL